MSFSVNTTNSQIVESFVDKDDVKFWMQINDVKDVQIFNIVFDGFWSFDAITILYGNAAIEEVLSNYPTYTVHAEKMKRKKETKKKIENRKIQKQMEFELAQRTPYVEFNEKE